MNTNYLYGNLHPISRTTHHTLLGVPGLHGKVDDGGAHVGTAPLGTLRDLSLPVVLGPVTVPTELGKVLTVVEWHLGFGGVFDLCQDVLLAVGFLGLVAQIVDPDPVALGPQLVERTVEDLEPLAAVGELDGVDFDVGGGGFYRFLRFDCRYGEPRFTGHRMAQLDQESVFNNRTEDAFLTGIEPLGLAELLNRHRTSKRRGCLPYNWRRCSGCPILHRSRTGAGSPLPERNVQAISPDHRAHDLNLIQRALLNWLNNRQKNST